MPKVIELADHLYQTLESSARTCGATPEDLLARLVKAYCMRSSLPPPGEVSPDDIQQATRALLHDEPPPWQVEWDELDRVRDSTDPYFATLEEAMSWARGYPWTLDN